MCFRLFLHHFSPFFFSLFSLPCLSLLYNNETTTQQNSQVVAEAPLYGFEQEYTMLTNSGNVYGWPQGGYPAPQGPFYCGVGSTSVYGRPLAEAHMVRRRRRRGRRGGETPSLCRFERWG